MTLQFDWTACSKCQGLFYGPFGEGSRCPADGGEHVPTHSFRYAVSFDVPGGDKVQPGWAACPKCQGMHFADSSFKGVCPRGGPHEQTNSFAYALTHDVAPTPWVQSEWRACPKCQGLFYGPFGGGSRCPADGGTHSAEGSFNYHLEFTPAIRLLAVQNGGRFIEVTGAGFTPSQSVKLEYHMVRGGAPTTHTTGERTVTSNGRGEFMDRIPVTIVEISRADVQATDLVSNMKVTASIEGV